MSRKVMKIKAPLLRDAKVWIKQETQKCYAEVVLDQATKDGSYPRVLLSEQLAEKLKGALRGEVLDLLVEKSGEDYYGLEVKREGEVRSVRPPRIISDEHVITINRKRYDAEQDTVWIKETCQGDDYLIARKGWQCIFTHEFGLETKVDFIFKRVGASIYKIYKEKLDSFVKKHSLDYGKEHRKMIDEIIDYGARELEVKVYTPKQIFLRMD